MYERILITGGAGFIGSHLGQALKLAAPSASIVAFDNLRRRGSELNLPALCEAGVAFVHGDIRSPEDLAALPEPPELIVDCSAEPSAQAGYGASPRYAIETNLWGLFHCLELARRSAADLLFLSTSRVYPYRLLNRLALDEQESRFSLAPLQTIVGASARGVSEAFPLEGPRSLYGMTKRAAELMIEEYADAYGLRYLIDRCGVIAGPRQMAKADQGVVTLWMAAHYFRKPLSYIGFGAQGKQLRDVLHVDDLCELLCEQIRHFRRYAGGCFNVGGGVEQAVSLREATALCESITGNSIPIGSVPEPRPADVKAYVTDVQQVCSTVEWRPRRGVAQTLADIYRWIRAEEKALAPALEN